MLAGHLLTHLALSHGNGYVFPVAEPVLRNGIEQCEFVVGRPVLCEDVHGVPVVAHTVGTRITLPEFHPRRKAHGAQFYV